MNQSNLQSFIIELYLVWDGTYDKSWIMFVFSNLYECIYLTDFDVDFNSCRFVKRLGGYLETQLLKLVK